MTWRLLSALPEEDVRLLLSTARRRVFTRNEIVFHRGDPADTLHLIQKGRFAVRVTTAYGDTVILAVLGPDDVFGELALLGGRQRTATVVALEPSETRAIHQLDFARLRREHPQVTTGFVELLGAQVERLSARLVEALYVPAERRVLLRLAELVEIYGDGSSQVVVPLTQEDLAGLAGTSRATVNKVLREQARAGVLELRRGRTVVLDPAGLADRIGRPV